MIRLFFLSDRAQVRILMHNYAIRLEPQACLILITSSLLRTNLPCKGADLKGGGGLPFSSILYKGYKLNQASKPKPVRFGLGLNSIN